VIGETNNEYWPRQIGTAMVLAFLTFLISFPACCAGLTGRFDQLHPHAKENSLGAFYFAVPIAIIFAILMFAGVMLRAYIRRRKEIAEETLMAALHPEEPRA
jgi:hypothetical protein